MSNSLKIRFVITLLLIAAAVGVRQNPGVLDDPLAMLGYKSKIVQAVIVEESTDRSKLKQPQIVAITKAASLGVQVIDKDTVGPDNKTPEVLVPFLAAAKDKPLPQLVRKWSNGRVTSVAMPLTFEKLQEAVK